MKVEKKNEKEEWERNKGIEEKGRQRVAETMGHSNTFHYISLLTVIFTFQTVLY